MNNITRRGLILGSSTGVVGLSAGCLGTLVGGEDGGGDGSGGFGDSNEDGNSTPEPQTIVDDRSRVREDEYQAWTWRTDQAVELTIEFAVREGPAIDMFTMERDEFDHLQAEERFRTITTASVEDEIDGFTTAELPSGSYAFVLDNTEVGEAEPPTNFSDDEATVEIEIVAQAV